MTRSADPGFDPRIADWLENDPGRAPAQVMEVVGAALPSLPQRRSWRAYWRFSAMPRVALAVALAGLLVIGVVAIFARPAIGPGNPTAPPSGLPSTAPSTATSSPAPATFTPVPTPASLVIAAADVGRTLGAGRYRFPDFAAPFTITLPADWKVSELTPTSISVQSASDSHINLYLAVIDKAYLDPCHTEDGPTIIGRTVAALVAAFSYMPGFDVADVTDATVGGAPGKAFKFSNSIDVATFKCSAENLPIGTHQKDGRDVDVTMFGHESDRFWVLDAGGTTVFAAITDNPQFVQAAQPVLQAISFEHGSPTPAPSASGPAGDLDATFVSARYGYRVDYSSAWTASQAAADPVTIDDPCSDPCAGDPFDGLDCGPYPPGCGDPGLTFGFFSGIAARPPAGLTAEQWIAANKTPACTSPLKIDTVTIDGHVAAVTCDTGLSHFHQTALLAYNGLVYRFMVSSPDARGERFLAMMASIHLVAPTPSN